MLDTFYTGWGQWGRGRVRSFAEAVYFCNCFISILISWLLQLHTVLSSSGAQPQYICMHDSIAIMVRQATPRSLGACGTCTSLARHLRSVGPHDCSLSLLSVQPNVDKAKPVEPDCCDYNVQIIIHVQVSTSTMKRICRKRGILSWPRRQIQKHAKASKQARSTV